MKRFIALIVVALLAACTTTGQPVQLTSKTPNQIAADVCPSVQAVVGVLAVPGAADPAIAADLVVAAPLIDAVCDSGSVNIADLQSLLRNGVPVLLKVIQAVPISPEEKQAATLGIALINAALAPLVQ